MFFKRNELYYMDDINFIIKDNWHMGMDTRRSMFLVKEYLKNKKLKEEHSFIISFREQLNIIDLEDEKCNKELDELLKNFYKRFNELKK